MFVLSFVISWRIVTIIGYLLVVTGMFVIVTLVLTGYGFIVQFLVGAQDFYVI